MRKSIKAAMHASISPPTIYLTILVLWSIFGVNSLLDGLLKFNEKVLLFLSLIAMLFQTLLLKSSPFIAPQKMKQWDE